MEPTGRQRLLAALRCEPVDRVPWVPFVGCHAGYLCGVSAREYLSSEDRIVQGVQKAIDRYRPDGIPVAFDLQIEAEALGCSLAWAEENPPSVVSHPLAEGRSLADLSIPGDGSGRIGTVLRATRRLRQANPDIGLYGLITGPFTLALHLLGTDIFMAMYDAPERVLELMAFCREVAEGMADRYIGAGCDVVAVVDPMTSQIGPGPFHEFVTPFASPVFERIRRAGRIGSFFVCGHAQQNIEAMCDCRPENISVDENIPLDFVRDVCAPRGVSFGGNLQLTTVLLLGTPLDAQRNALACLTVGGTRGFILAPGCDLPYQTPPENIEAVSRLVGDPYEQDVVRTMGAQEGPGQTLDMSEYGQLDRVIVDIITLDSEACAPCQYMVEAVRAVVPEFNEIVEWREHKIKYRESLVFMTSLMVRNIPTICIDGKITFVSRIPHRDELIAAIQRRVNEKLRIKIRRNRGEFILLGNGDTREVEESIRQAAREMGTEVTIHVVTGEKQFYEYGLAPVQAPAVVLARYQVKSTNRVPEVSVVKEWIKQIL